MAAIGIKYAAWLHLLRQQDLMLLNSTADVQLSLERLATLVLFFLKRNQVKYDLLVIILS